MSTDPIGIRLRRLETQEKIDDGDDGPWCMGCGAHWTSHAQYNHTAASPCVHAIAGEAANRIGELEDALRLSWTALERMEADAHDRAWVRDFVMPTAKAAIVGDTA